MLQLWALLSRHATPLSLSHVYICAYIYKSLTYNNSSLIQRNYFIWQLWLSLTSGSPHPPRSDKGQLSGKEGWIQFSGRSVIVFIVLLISRNLALASGLTAFPQSYPGSAFCGLCFYKDLSSTDTATVAHPTVSPARCHTSPPVATTTNRQNTSTNSTDSTSQNSQLRKERTEQKV